MKNKNNSQETFLQRNVQMMISSVVNKNKQKIVYVMFTEDEKKVEIRIPDFVVIKNNGFSKERIDNLVVYCKVNKEQLLKRASKISIMDAFLEKH
ncbi:hypothetical protein [Lachnobacterium bovis]|uniref:hypothetical protein n=1 Tax=Lachnobacterium bovis TaxID=140626 RepID=UPI00048FEA80|nr:hypothetical protein [Lachnobacterium bovis]